mmetsp:Transcript_33049/g.55313  ORF Transcript_33049/g.55313 Transcript_33049/m.55313 type:complete len:261 (-) Transcript_33049:211-993(-)|eukprot:CAMPEP_0198216170 /NCGR_PEP_ID=MMETSP1445-20131203/55520_1 /TAXON_ID=36898 /ORGANISM="Pyramimonas sp., Strain CCMP2087" /LENGTH=260 /DNA_ID=CAMNT_0043892283 /DNA_START=246 /DNA_END=1028 /DNA_ORIENTATION=-
MEPAQSKEQLRKLVKKAANQRVTHNLVAHIYWFSCDVVDMEKPADLKALGIPCTVTDVPIPVMRSKKGDTGRHWEWLTEGEDGKGASPLGELIKLTEGKSWDTAENTRKRVFLGFSGGFLGCLLGAAMEHGPWCGLLISWVGWTAPSKVLGNTAVAQRVLQRLHENLGVYDTTPDHADFPGWQRNNTSDDRCERLKMYVAHQEEEGNEECALLAAEQLQSALENHDIDSVIVCASDIHHDWSGSVSRYIEDMGDWIRRRT